MEPTADHVGHRVLKLRRVLTASAFATTWLSRLVAMPVWTLMPTLRIAEVATQAALLMPPAPIEFAFATQSG